MSVSDLTKVEVKILGLRARSFDNNYIATWLTLTTHEVEGHLNDIYRKLGIPRAQQGESDTTKAVAMVRRAGLLTWRTIKEPSRSVTPREREVGQGIVDGLTNKKIATKLMIGENSVKRVIGALRTKTLANSREELADMLLQLQLVD